MSEGGDTHTALPLLRHDLEFFEGTDDINGSPTCTILDPNIGKYHKIGWAESIILKNLKPQMTALELITVLEKNSTLRASKTEIDFFFEFLKNANLLEGTCAGKSTECIARDEAQKKGLINTLLSQYLYIRVPLLKPDPFLRRFQHFYAVLCSKTVLLIAFLFFILGISLVIPRSDEYFGTFLHFFTPLGALYYALSLVVIKTIHEFSHGFMAVRMGARVRTMGIAFIVFWPIPYCDVTDAWKIPSRRKRALIAAAGMGSEIALAGVALVVWALSAPGIIQSIAFFLSSLSLLSSLLMNANPAMRFDGYYILSDIWGIDNLHKRSIALALWKWRRLFWGIQSPAPECHKAGTSLALISFGIYSLVYRFFLYLGIALMVYHHFTKTLGILLFSIELYLFIIKPIYNEVQNLWALRTQIRRTPTAFLLQGSLFLSLCYITIPLPRTYHIPAIAVPQHSQTIYIPQEGLLSGWYIKNGMRVTKGQLLAVITSAQLDYEIIYAKAEYAILQSQEIRALQEQKQGQATAELHFGELREARARAQTQYENVLQQRKQLEIRAQQSGVLFDVDHSIGLGSFMRKQQVVARIAEPTDIELEAYVPEKWISHIQKGSLFKGGTSLSNSRFNGRITQVSSLRMQHLAYPSLANTYGGPIAVTPTADKRLSLVGSWYKVHGSLINKAPLKLHFYQKMEITLYSSWHSPLLSTLQYAWMSLVQQSGF